MAITTSGGSGSGTQAVTNGGVTVTLFTTPNTANTIYVVTWHVVSAIAIISGCIAVGNGVASPAITSGVTIGTQASAEGVIKAGPSTAVTLSMWSSANDTVKWDYTYVGITFS